MMLIVSLEVQRLSGSLRVSSAIWVKKRSQGKAQGRNQSIFLLLWIGQPFNVNDCLLPFIDSSCSERTESFSTSNGKTRKNVCKRSSNSHDHFQQCIYYWKQMFLHAATSQSAFAIVALTSLQNCHWQCQCCRADLLDTFLLAVELIWALWGKGCHWQKAFKARKTHSQWAANGLSLG